MSSSPKTLITDYLKEHFPYLIVVAADLPRGQMPIWRTAQFHGETFGVDLTVDTKKPTLWSRDTIYPGEALFSLGEPLADGKPEDAPIADRIYGRNLHRAVSEALAVGRSIYMAKPTALIAVYDVLVEGGSLIEASFVLVDGDRFPDAKMVVNQ